MTRHPKSPAPLDPGIRPNGIRARAMAAVMAHGPRPEDPEATRRSQEHWRRFREQQQKLADDRAASKQTNSAEPIK